MPARFALGRVIRARRLELGWTQEELAERISRDGEYIRQSEVSRLENGKVALPRRERLERIAAALDLPLGELLARSGWAGAEPHFQSPTGQRLPHESSPSTTADALAAFQRMLAAMREQSDRPQRDRQVIDDIEQQLLQLLETPDGVTVEPTPNVTDD